MAVTDEPAGPDPAHADPSPAKEYGWVALLTSVLGLWASAALAVDYIRRLADEEYVASCDINPMIGCGLFLDSPAASTFAIPNVIVGVAAFPVMATLAVLLLTGARFPVWVWRGMTVGTLFGVGFVTYLQYQAMFVLHGLCPWCLVIWVVMIPLFVHTTTRAGEAGALGKGSRQGWVKNRWIITVLWYLIIIGAIMLTLGADLIAAL
ncbi:MAG TPA: vitamin K epoxide reductase family protein [Beutenbergiaceae bacterium]|nr:vitamin K epoxide reductase family protein [Beutenbergiaceae bacterium]